MIKIKNLFAALLFLLPALCMSQQNPIDSLKKVIIAAPNDTNKVNMLIELSMKYRGVSLDSTIKYGMDAKTLAEKQNYAKGTGYALKAIGLAYNMQGDYVNAMQAYKEALAIFEANGIKVGVANMLNNIGVIFYYYSLLDSAQDYYLKSLKISEEIKDTLRIATALAGVGGVYSWKAATYDKAMEFHRRALLLGIASGDSDLVAGSNGNIADLFVSIFLYQKDTIKQNQKTPDSLHPDSTLLDSAILYLKQAQKFYGVLPNLPFALNSIGKVYKMKKEFHLAEDYYRQGYDKAKYFDSKKDMADALLGIAETYREKGDLKAAIPVYIDAEKMFLDIGLEETYDIEIVYSGLTTCFSKLKDYDSAFKYQKSLIDVKKKIYDIDTDKKLGTKLFAFEVEKREGEIILQKAVISRQKLIRNGFIGGFAVVLLFAGVFFTQRNRISKEKKRSDELLLNILPEETAEELKATGTAKAKSFDMVSVLFTDFKNFTQASEILTPEELVAEINHCYSEFDKIITRHGIEKIKTIGDAYMCAGGLPRHNSTNPVDVVSAGLEMVAFIEKNKQERIANGQPFFELRCGIHTGPVVAGIVGIKKFAYDIWGDTVNTASRMESSGEIGKVNVSGATYELVKDKFKCNYRGKVKAKNKGEIDMYFVESLIGLHMV